MVEETKGDRTMTMIYFVVGLALGFMFLVILAAICYYHTDPVEDVLPMTERGIKELVQ